MGEEDQQSISEKSDVLTLDSYDSSNEDHEQILQAQQLHDTNIQPITSNTSTAHRLNLSRFSSIRSIDSKAVSIVRKFKDIVDQVKDDNSQTNAEYAEQMKTPLGRQMTNLDLDDAFRIATREVENPQFSDDSQNNDSTVCDEEEKTEAGEEVTEKGYQEYKEESKYKVDSSLSWLVCFGELCLLIATWGSSSGYGVFLSYYLENNYFEGATATDYAIVGSLVICLAQLLAPFAIVMRAIIGLKPVMILGALMLAIGFIVCSWATDIWFLYVFQGVLGGTGFALCFQPAMPVLATWFDVHRGLATGIVTGGAGAGGVLFSLSAQKVIEATGGFQWAIRMFGIMSIAFNVVAIICIKERLKSDRLKTWAAIKERLKFTLDFSVLQKWYVFSISFWFATMIMAYIVSLYSLSAFCTFIGLTQKQGSNVTAIYNGFQAIGRPLLGTLGDRVGRVNLSLITPIIVMILTLALWTNCTTYASVIVFAVLSGTTSGVASVMAVPLFSDALPPKQFFSAWSFSNMIVGLCSLVPEVVALKLRQPESSTPFLHAQIFSGMMNLAAFFILLPLRAWKVKKLVIKRLADTEELLTLIEEDQEIPRGMEGVSLERLTKRRQTYSALLVPGWKGVLRRILYPIKS